MKNTKVLFMAGMTALLSVGALTGCKKNGAEDKYDKSGRLILNVKNVYFETWDGSDTYTEELNEKFNVSIKPTNYDYADWDEMVNTSMNGSNLKDMIHFNLKAYNFGSTYENWVDQLLIKALPDDMSKWPNLKSMLDNISNIDALKIGGKLYCIPIANDISNPNKDFSNFTYVYRRDWAKKIDEENKGKSGYPVYREGDVYTWQEFENLLEAFKKNPQNEKASPLVDEEWGFPSVTNFYKDVPHCFTKDENGKAINAFTSSQYEAGLLKAREFVDKGYYSEDQFLFTASKANEQYVSGQAAVLYDNFSLVNYTKLRKAMRKNENVDDATAILKIKDPNGNYALEGTENWFSVTMFNYDISEEKMNKILDIMDYLLSEEGTRLAIYGKEGYDYTIVDGQVKLTEKGWEKDQQGNYAPKINGAKYLRYMATLGNDTKSFDPYTDMDAYNILNAWSEEMKQAKAANKLRVIKEPADIDWMSTPQKNDKYEGLLFDANVSALQFAFRKISDLAAYEKTFDTKGWRDVLSEINQRLGKE